MTEENKNINASVQNISSDTQRKKKDVFSQKKSNQDKRFKK